MVGAFSYLPQEKGILAIDRFCRGNRFVGRGLVLSTELLSLLHSLTHFLLSLFKLQLLFRGEDIQYLLMDRFHFGALRFAERL
jgi:hypothetical protein